MKGRRALLITALLASAANAPATQDHAVGEDHAVNSTAGDNAPDAAAVTAIDKPSLRFAAELAQMPLDDSDQPVPTIDAAWRTLAQASDSGRQAARWNLARSLARYGSPAEELGVLSVMQMDDPDLSLVSAWRLANGVALARIGRTSDALASLSDPGLTMTGTACAWRMRLLARMHDWEAAGKQFRCAAPAMDAMPAWSQHDFRIAAAQTAIGIMAPENAMTLLAPLAESDTDANLVRGKALLALGKYDEGLLKLRRVALAGSPQQRAAAQLAIIETGIASKSLSAKDAADQLDALLYHWRGDDTEREALKVRWKLAETMGDKRGALDAGARLFRYFDLGPKTRPVLEKLQGMLSNLLNDQQLPLSQAAGVYWEYRDLAPTGGAGDAVASNLADRLADARLFGRAAELLRYQMDNRATDIAKGPLSVRIAELQLLDGNPEGALEVIRASDGPPYPETMLTDRRRMSAVALFRLGKKNEAMAMLDLVPDSAPLKAEMLWHQRDWSGFVKANGRALPAPAGLNAAAETAVLRQAVALAMQGNEAGLSDLKRRYGPAMSKRPSGKALALLTDRPDQVDPGAIEAALAAMPGAASAGPLTGLIEGDAG
ncbi:hypothetical protein [Stakelama pacifica]|uniref:Tetratricopeptide repeat protein n=1 Tax=Stakelama pacifica TaxID=517720 RepID=A0A4R6FJU4_9SPHN|nr:hypothetical protein [Stakelama pacifica]TDN81160.1 hypothetical protein EV664_108102 [Stakelama pacifica]GGO96930.1 hypothetical protein GCM10011329_24590 [Stakelama pacifica]